MKLIINIKMGGCFIPETPKITKGTSSPMKENEIQERKFNESNFKKLKLIGQGSFGDVYLVQFSQNGKYYAMKVLNKSILTSKNLKTKTKSNSYSFR